MFNHYIRNAWQSVIRIIYASQADSRAFERVIHVAIILFQASGGSFWLIIIIHPHVLQHTSLILNLKLPSNTQHNIIEILGTHNRAAWNRGAEIRWFDDLYENDRLWRRGIGVDELLQGVDMGRDACQIKSICDVSSVFDEHDDMNDSHMRHTTTRV